MDHLIVQYLLKYRWKEALFQDLLNNEDVPQPKNTTAPVLNLTDVFDALREPLRREIIRRLAKQESLCSSFADLGSASGLSYHFARLRSAGLTNTRKLGTCRLISLRKREIEAQFPRLLESLLKESTSSKNG